MKPTLKKQSSFLIEINKSMVEIDNMSDNEMGNSGFRSRADNPRLTKLKSSQGLIDNRGRGSTLGLA